MVEDTQKDGSDPSTSKARLRLWLRLMGFSRSIEVLLRENFRKNFQSTLPRFDVLAALDRMPEGMNMSELSSALRVSNGNITGLIDRLVDDGFAQRSAVPGDRRAHRISLTPAGRRQFSDMATAHEEWIDKCLQDFEIMEAVELSERLRGATNLLHSDQPEH
jgi:DNA-binding MarR family transcriptional regulator